MLNISKEKIGIFEKGCKTSFSKAGVIITSWGYRKPTSLSRPLLFLLYKDPLFSFHDPSFRSRFSHFTSVFFRPCERKEEPLRIMEKLLNDLLTTIFERVVAFGVQDHLNFIMTSRFHHQFATKKVILRALNRDCLWLSVDPLPWAAQRRFAHRLSKSGHAFYSVALATFMLHQVHANLEEIKLILAKAIKHGSDGAMYFNLMLRILANEGFSENEVLSSFQSLFIRR